jgi:hypothetical protein
MGPKKSGSGLKVSSFYPWGRVGFFQFNVIELAPRSSKQNGFLPAGSVAKTYQFKFLKYLRI